MHWGTCRHSISVPGASPRRSAVVANTGAVVGDGNVGDIVDMRVSWIAGADMAQANCCASVDPDMASVPAVGLRAVATWSK